MAQGIAKCKFGLDMFSARVREQANSVCMIKREVATCEQPMS